MWTTVVTTLVLLAISATVSAQGFECPAGSGYYPDPQYCDKYYDCVDGVATEKNCIDGFVFNPKNPRIEQCDFPFAVPCTTRTLLQDAQVGDLECPRANGYFAHEDPGQCDEFYFCNAGKVSKLTCPDGLHFSRESGNCAWPAVSNRQNCITKTEELGFSCPSVTADRAAAHPRYPDPEDCKFFFVCVNGKSPRRSGCDFGSVFNPGLERCDSANNVPGCEGYYKEQFNQLINQAGGLGNVDLVDSIANSFVIPEDRGTGNVNPGNRARRPTGTAVNVPADTRTPSRQRPAAAAARPGAQRPAANRPLRRRRPGATRRRKTTTTTTTTPAPEYYDDYYYYDETAPGANGANYYDEDPAPGASEAAVETPVPQKEVVQAEQVPEEPAPAAAAAVEVEPTPQPASSSRPRRPAFVRPQRTQRTRQ